MVINVLARKAITQKAVERFYAGVDKVSVPSCWLWTKGLSWEGSKVGRISTNQRWYAATVFSYVLHLGDLQENETVYANCGTPYCCHPDHLFVTKLEQNKDIKTRLLENVEENPDTGCWEWQLSVKSKSAEYGQLSIGCKSHLVHRLSYEVFKGEIPHGLFVCHVCDHKKCINPEHLFLGTNSDNIVDCVNKGKANPRFGEQHHNSKLDADKVREVKELNKQGLSSEKIAKRFNVSGTTILRVLRQECWKHVK